MNTTYSQNGTYLAIGGIVVQIATHFGINVTVDQAVFLIAGIATFSGIVYQSYLHRKLASATGTLPTPTV